MTALHYTAQYGLDALAELLLARGADPLDRDDAGRSAHELARSGAHALTLAILADPVRARAVAAAAAARRQAQLDTANLLKAAELGDVKWATELLDAGADLTFQDPV